VRVFLPDGIDFDIFRVVHVDELLVDVRTIGSWVRKCGIELAALVPDLWQTYRLRNNQVFQCTYLSEKPTTVSPLEVNVDAVILAADWFLHKWLLQYLAVDYDRIAVFPHCHFRRNLKTAQI
jgi:hypothetical protein